MSTKTNTPLLVITGPTACGKTATAINMATALEGEIISADSMQIYKEMDIGTAKPREEEKRNIPHYLMDAVSPSYPFSVADFASLGHAAIQTIYKKNKTPILCGGTGFYVNALLKNTEFVDTEADFIFRKELETFAQKHSNDMLHKELEKIDPVSAQNIHPNNVKRVIRAMEYYKQTGKKISVHNKEEKEKKLFYPTVIVKLYMEREKLYARINQRVDLMIEKGLVDEVADLLTRYDKELPSMQGIGYKEIALYVLGEISLEDAITEMKTNTRRLAKRQLSWMRHQMPDDEHMWFLYDPLEDPTILKNNILSYYYSQIKKDALYE